MIFGGFAMSTSTPIAPESTASAGETPTVPVYRFGVDQYLALIEAGVLSGNDRVELIDGWIVPKMTKNPPHVIATRMLFEVLSRIAPEGWLISKEDPIVLDRSVPEPDIAVIRGRSEDFRTRHPNAGDVALIVEVAESSRPRDRGEKLRAYAASGIPNYWLVDLTRSVVESYSEPDVQSPGGVYRHMKTHGQGDELPLVLDGREVGRIVVSDIMP